MAEEVKDHPPPPADDEAPVGKVGSEAQEAGDDGSSDGELRLPPFETNLMDEMAHHCKEAEERNLLAVALHHQVRERQRALAVLEQAEADAAITPLRKRIIDRYREEELKPEIRAIVAEVLELVNGLLKDKADLTATALVFYHKMIGDFTRYVTDVEEGEKQDLLADDANTAYLAAKEASAELLPSHPVVLALALNFSLFHYEVMSSPREACRIAKEAYDTAMPCMDKLTPDGLKQSRALLKTIKENVQLWAGQVPTNAEEAGDDSASSRSLYSGSDGGAAEAAEAHAVSILAGAGAGAGAADAYA